MNSIVESKIKEIIDLKAKLNSVLASITKVDVANYLQLLLNSWVESVQFSDTLKDISNIRIQGEHEFNDGDATYLSWHYKVKFQSSNEEIFLYGNEEERDIDSYIEGLNIKEKQFLLDIASSCDEIINAIVTDRVRIDIDFKTSKVEVKYIV